MSILVISMITIVGTVSYGFFSPSRTQTGNNTLISGCFNVTMEENTSSIALTNAYPIDDEKGLAGTPYTITITNTCDTEARYHLLLDTKNGSFSSSHIKTAVDTQPPKILADYQTNTSYQAGTDYSSSNILKSGNLAKNESATMSIRLWIDSATTYEDVQGKNWEGQVRIVNIVKAVEYANSPAMKTLEKLNATVKTGRPNFGEVAPATATYKSQINSFTFNQTMSTTQQSNYMTYSSEMNIDEKTGKFSLVNPQVCKYSECLETLKGKYVVSYRGVTSSSGETATDLSQLYLIDNSTTLARIYYKSVYAVTATYDYSQDGIYETEDDYGISYYYRGGVTNNYVKFANKYWRIVRVNGDGTLRVIYEGDTPRANGDAGYEDITSEDELMTVFAGLSAWNADNYDDAKYVGYMYGGANGEASTSKEQAQTNQTDTAIKTFLDGWYKTAIVDTGNDRYVSDTLFCNDRSTVSTPTSLGQNYGDTGLGYGKNITLYGFFNRNIGESDDHLPLPILKCPQKNDAFTVNDTEKGNGALAYPVGLITVDEVNMAGGVVEMENGEYYLYRPYHYWSFSPYGFYGGGARVWYVYYGYISNYGVYGGGAVAPVINLSTSFVESMTGDGSLNNPFSL